MAHPSTSAEPIPDRRRKHFPLNGGPRPTTSERARAKRWISEARQVLNALESSGPSDPTIVKRLTPEQVVRARRGIAHARQNLEAGNTEAWPQDEADNDHSVAA